MGLKGLPLFEESNLVVYRRKEEGIKGREEGRRVDGDGE